MRLLYTLAMFIATPLLMLRLWARGMRYGDYHQRWRERFGLFASPAFKGRSLWVHAVSLGEVNAAEPLIKALMARYPDWPMVVTTVTPTGSERVQQLFGDKVFHVYLPYDLPFSVQRFLKRVQPRLAVIVETEIWPNLYAACHKRDIPLLIVNARLSRRSLRGYMPLRSLARQALHCVYHVAAQSLTDAARYRLLGTRRESISVAGNLKFDMPLPDNLVSEAQAMREAWGEQRPVWIAASTHEGEEMLALEAHLEILQRFPDALLLLVPRHPERFRAVEHSIRGLGFRMASRSGDRLPDAATQCFLVDAMGELMRFYAAADVAFVGGSLEPIGGHNLLEPASLAKPVLVGPHTFNFQGITRGLLRVDGARRVTAQNLGASVRELFEQADVRERMGRAAREVFEHESGAVGRIMARIEPLLE
ncbi:lipid IV(A) 3-deoxy-D-manno-octulosonic acid transferase [Oleiagrimonas soli]|uniref:3-deoxy-D-manno-octulosonic acid transferase n=1 Tax=Oleiagrimonas soli TaxID=1543381 RepID=A0A099CUI5_9GAMM|nr:lipid IV(A) 3-deoxy-D-manno-octulosonic acid transferase [Oleiagrimonas soli]KGI76665.1 3-deoxy-D-manno-octulosonic acid transferase [Oleiagrimonas soli]MBB6185125.1 3-deoxy-D-manno-octulosonic-acid transferase [Oleiagrimonas soli]